MPVENSLDMHRLGLQVAVKPVSTKLSPLATLLDSTKRSVQLWEVWRIDRYSTALKSR